MNHRMSNIDTHTQAHTHTHTRANTFHACFGVVLAILFMLSCSELLFSQTPRFVADKACREEDYETVVSGVSSFCDPEDPIACYTLASCTGAGVEPLACEACLDILAADSGTYSRCTGAMAQPGVCQLKGSILDARGSHLSHHAGRASCLLPESAVEP